MSASNNNSHAVRISSRGESEITIWPVINGLVAQHNAVNLGQGFPDWPAPLFVKEAACAAIMADKNQYAPSKILTRMANAIASAYSPSFGRTIDASEVVSAVGGCESLFACIFALLDTGDEAILLEPFFDVYHRQVLLAGGVPVVVPLRIPESVTSPTANDYVVSMEALEAAVSPKTRFILINNPHNPLGKVWTRSELVAISEFAIRHNLVVISDEVYQHLVFDGQEMVHMASLPNMWERTLTVCSAGKTFSVTGWKIGWAVGPQTLVDAVWSVRQGSTFTVAHPLQDAVAVAFEVTMPGAEHSNYWMEYNEDMARRRTRLEAALSAAGLHPLHVSGSYFVCCDISSLPVPAYTDDVSRDFAAVRWLISTFGIAAIPMTAFYTSEHRALAENTLRFCFCKNDETLAKAEAALKKLGEALRSP